MEQLFWKTPEQFFQNLKMGSYNMIQQFWHIYVCVYIYVYIYSHKNAYMNDHSSFIHNNQKVETIQMLMMYKQNVINHNSRILLNWKSNEVLIHATKWMELENIYAMWEKPYKKATNYVILLIWNVQNWQWAIL